MRISCRKDDPGYVNFDSFTAVYLDGKKLDHCFTADDKEGFALIYRTDEKGELIPSKKHDGVIEERVTGNIEFKEINPKI